MMKDQNKSSVSLFGKSDFLESDPYWYRIVVLSFKLAAILALAWILKEYFFPAMALSKAGSLLEFLKIWKAGKGPPLG